MKPLHCLVSFVAALGAFSSPEARAGDVYELKTQIFVFKSADVSLATATDGGTPATLGSTGHWSVFTSPLEIKCGGETLKIKGPDFAWTGLSDGPAKFNLVSSPQISTAPDKEVKVTIGENTQYLEKQADGSFRLHEVPAGSPDSAHCDLLISATPTGPTGEDLQTRGYQRPGSRED